MPVVASVEHLAMLCDACRQSERACNLAAMEWPLELDVELGTLLGLCWDSFNSRPGRQSQASMWKPRRRASVHVILGERALGTAGIINHVC